MVFANLVAKQQVIASPVMFSKRKLTLQQKKHQEVRIKYKVSLSALSANLVSYYPEIPLLSVKNQHRFK